jgi:hypothetical protein
MPRAEEEAVRQDRELIRVSPALRYFAVGPRHNAGLAQARQALRQATWTSYRPSDRGRLSIRSRPRSPRRQLSRMKSAVTRAVPAGVGLSRGVPGAIRLTARLTARRDARRSQGLGGAGRDGFAY